MEVIIVHHLRDIYVDKDLAPDWLMKTRSWRPKINNYNEGDSEPTDCRALYDALNRANVAKGWRLNAWSLEA